MHTTGLPADSPEHADSSVEGAVVVVGAGAGEGGSGFVPGESPRVISCGEAEGAGTLQLVLQAPADEGRLLGYFAGFLLVVVVGQADHGVGLRQVPTEGGTFGWLEKRFTERELVSVCSNKQLLWTHIWSR